MYFFITFHMFREKQSKDIKMSNSWLYKNHICRSKCLMVSLQSHSQIKQLETEHPVRGGCTGGMGGRPPPQKLAVYETKLAKIRLPKIQKIALCRVRPPPNRRLNKFTGIKSMYPDFQEKIFTEVSRKKFQTFH